MADYYYIKFNACDFLRDHAPLVKWDSIDMIAEYADGKQCKLWIRGETIVVNHSQAEVLEMIQEAVFCLKE